MTDHRGIVERAAAVAAILALGAIARPVEAQESARWAAWLGCWEPVAERLGPAEVEGATRLCMEPAASGVRVVASAPGEAAVERLLIADGTRQPVDEGGCTGWETATWSAYGHRLYVESELDCEGFPRAVSGVMAMVPGGEWLDIRAVTPGPVGAVRVVRYRAVGEPAAERALAAQTARAAAAMPLSADEIAEATRRTDAVVVETLLLERGDGYDLDAAALSKLADAGVPGRVVDVMVALSYPDRFMIDRAGGAVAAAPDEPSDYAERAPLRAYDPYFASYRGRYDPFFYSPYGSRYGRYGYGHGGYDPYGLGGWYGGGPIIIVRPGEGGGSGEGSAGARGRRVSGEGYTGSGGRSMGSARPKEGSSGVRSAGSVTTRPSAGTTSSGSKPTTGRKAKPRGSGGK